MSEETKIPSPADPEETAAPEAKPEPAPKKESPRRLSRRQQKRRERSVFQYIAILFAAAFVLLLLTFLMEKRQYELLQEQSEEQIDDLQQSVSAVQSLQKLYDENAALKDELECAEISLSDRMDEIIALTEERERLQQRLWDQEKQIQSMDWFWQINEAYVRGKYSLCRDLIFHLEMAGLVDDLPRESITGNGRFSPYDRYQEIYDAVN